jgi:hypothetical protein
MIGVSWSLLPTQAAEPQMVICLQLVKIRRMKTVTLKEAGITFPAILLGIVNVWTLRSDKYMNQGSTRAIKQARSDLGGLLIDSLGKCYCPTRLERGEPLEPWWDFKNRLLLGRLYEWKWEFRVEPSIGIAETRTLLLEYAERGSCSKENRRYLRYLAKAQSFDEFSKLILDELNW